MNYGFEHNGNVYGPDGLLPGLKADETEDYNKAAEAKEIEWLKTGPDKVSLYVKYHPVKMSGTVNPHSLMRETITSARWTITTWLGTEVCPDAVMGLRVNVGFGFNTYRRAVRCRIFGVLYHGWYMESSGEYCRLKKAKRQ